MTEHLVSPVSILRPDSSPQPPDVPALTQRKRSPPMPMSPASRATPSRGGNVNHGLLPWSRRHAICSACTYCGDIFLADFSTVSTTSGQAFCSVDCRTMLRWKNLRRVAAVQRVELSPGSDQSFGTSSWDASPKNATSFDCNSFEDSGPVAFERVAISPQRPKLRSALSEELESSLMH
uniref:FLZ-type domain-containing protein n=1 Tax=Rhizochromulina marina TaxID=1034831 RepID=A0A7S2W481_9STRA|mmetsp:Transcript_13778/g.40273  ORF Transcript_13778/g.40273 Transcript_13778/m.40273 type:complete len:178 (+) Transcript_13778:296-829(+)